MKRLLVLLLAALMLLTSCGGTGDVNTPETDPSSPSVVKDDFSVAVKEDAFVCDVDGNGDQSMNNFGSASTIELKSAGYRRYTYLKFDISSLAGDDSFTSVELDLTFISRQFDVQDDIVIVIHGCDTNWSENTITFVDQPTIFSEITRFTGLSTEEMGGGAIVTKSFPVTDYIKLCLAEGKTEAAFYIEEATPVKNGIRVEMYSKESGKTGPVLNVSYTKEDKNVYNGNLAEPLPEISENGLDKLFGLVKNGGEEGAIVAIEDTYIQGGANGNTVFGDADVMEVKHAADTSYHRLSFVKFSLEELYSADYNDIYLTLTYKAKEDNPTSLVKIFACDPDSWNEKTLTYNNNNTVKGKLISTDILGVEGVVSANVTEYVDDMIIAGATEVSFIIENEGYQGGSAKRFAFDTKEKKDGTPAYLALTGDINFTTFIRCEGENPWQVAMDNVTTWFERFEEIKKGGDKDAEKVVWNDADFKLTVGAATMTQTNGADTVYVNKSTRLLSTLDGYKYNKNEASLYDEYGGFMGGEKYEATGYFYTVKIGDRWWTIDPLGYPFYRVACVQVTPGVSSAQKKAVISEFNTNSKWAAFATDLLKDYGFNSTGGWSDIKTLSRIEEPLAETRIIEVLGGYAREVGLRTGHGGGMQMVGDVMPVFDPDFVEYADKVVKADTKGYEDKAYIYGWMTDNELPDNDYMLDNTLMVDPDEDGVAYSYATAWTFMYLKTGKANVSVYDVTPELRDEYKAMVYDKYFEVVTGALDKYVPNHQYMGCRFLPENDQDEYIMRVAGYWCDVISINYYGAWTPSAERMYNWQYWAGRPFIITEWYAKGMDVWEKDNRMENKSGGGWTVRTQEERGMYYQNFALGLFECKGCVGSDWFKYWDNDPDDLSADSSNRDANKGIFSTSHEEYTDVTKYMKELNNNKYSLIEFLDER